MAGSSADVDPRRLVRLEAERVANIGGSDFPSHYPGEDHTWNVRKFTASRQITINSLSSSVVSFDLVGLDASVANALRRVLVAEVPAVAVEDVFMYNNTSIVQDEVLSHRLGLVPIKVDPRRVKMKKLGDVPNDMNTFVFNLNVTCTRNPEAAKGETDPKKLFRNESVYSGDMTWEPAGRQKNLFKDTPARPVLDDILLAKLRPGQGIECEMHAVLGIAKDHAKFSPVSTASYRLLPHITLLGDVPPEHIDHFIKCFSPGVIEDYYEGGVRKVRVKDARKDTVSREALRHKKFEGLVELGRVRDHFIFNIESTGMYDPEDLLPEAIDVLIGKVDEVAGCLHELEGALVGAAGAGLIEA